MSDTCKRCGKPRQSFQVFCGAACSALWEMGDRGKPPDAGARAETCEHDWQWGEGRNAGSATCTKCLTWRLAWIIAFDLRTELNAAKAEHVRRVLLDGVKLSDLRAQLAAAQERERVMREALETLRNGTRDYSARGLGETCPVDYEMPPSTAKRVRALIDAALA